MATITLQILPETTISIKDGSVVIDGAVDGTILITNETVVNMAGEEAVLNGGTITFGATIL
jgi:hypothetical protein